MGDGVEIKMGGHGVDASAYPRPGRIPSPSAAGHGVGVSIPPDGGPIYLYIGMKAPKIEKIKTVGMNGIEGGHSY